MGGMGLLLVFLMLVLTGQSFAILACLVVERYTSSYTGLIAFIVAYFIMFWVAWKFAVWLTEPGKRLAKFMTKSRDRQQAAAD